MMIRKANQADMYRILDIYQIARDYMKSRGNPQQWGDDFPPAGLLENDIQQGQLYVLLEDDVIHGVFAFVVGEEPAYRHIESGCWKSDAPYGTIHRIAGDGKIKGVFESCLRFCKAHSHHIRIDTHHDNQTMQHLIVKNGFAKCGIIHVEDGSPRIAYEWTGTPK